MVFLFGGVKIFKQCWQRAFLGTFLYFFEHESVVQEEMPF